MKRYVTTLLLLIITIFSYGQKVGLVLSGGGAKGMYHVGMIKALEENGIPIDYVTGTSMGSIVGSMYAIGYTPDEMMKFFISDSVQSWLDGQIPKQYTYFFKRFEPTPEMFAIDLHLNKEDRVNVQLPVNIISPYKIDLALMTMLQPSSWAANQDFDSLMVPFRCIASDVYNKKAVTFKNGSLPFAIRASMTIPFVFTPLTLDSVLLYDGGLYDNFPYKAMQEDFKPDVMIGGVCTENDPNPKVNDLFGQIMVMISNPTDYSLPDSNDVVVRRIFDNVGMLDYDKAGIIMQQGYDDAIKLMPKIKESIPRRISSSELAAKRASFKNKLKPLYFEQITIAGLTDKQKNYVLRQLGLDENQIFTHDYFEEKYMRILATGLFKAGFPEVTYNPESGFFKLKLEMSTKSSMKISLGGNISSSSLNQGYVGFEYRHVSSHATTHFLRGYFGTFYNSVVLGGRHDIYTQFPFYFEYRIGYENSNYESSNMNNYYKNRNFRMQNSTNWFLNMSAATSVFSNWAARAFLNFNINNSRYFTTLHTSQDLSDLSQFYNGELGLELQSRETNYTQYSTEGFNRRFTVKYVYGLEKYTPGSVSVASATKGKNQQWLEARAFSEQDYRINKWFNIGYLVEAVYSTIGNFRTDIYNSYMSPVFAPTPHSTTMFMPEFRSSAFIGAGVSPIFKFTRNEKFYLKTYAYGFVPREILKANNPLEKIKGIFGGTLVYQTPIGPASFTLTKYTTGPKNWTYVLGFGYAIFNAKRN